MPRQAAKRLLLIGLPIVALGCARLPEQAAPGDGGAIAAEQLVDIVSIPSEWGSLIAVLAQPESTLRKLWLQDDTGTIRIVTFNERTQQLSTTVGVIRRQ